MTWPSNLPGLDSVRWGPCHHPKSDTVKISSTPMRRYSKFNHYQKSVCPRSSWSHVGSLSHLKLENRRSWYIHGFLPLQKEMHRSPSPGNFYTFPYFSVVINIFRGT
jgi:hypothetical protein